RRPTQSQYPCNCGADCGGRFTADVAGEAWEREEPRRRTKHRKSNNNSNAPEPCKNNIRNYGQSYTGGSMGPIAERS
ncbi:hypothetical protein MTP99_006722, partial [Tenebrio molitor]